MRAVEACPILILSARHRPWNNTINISVICAKLWNIRIVRHQPLEVTVLRNSFYSLVNQLVVVGSVNTIFLAKFFDHFRFHPTITFGTSCSIVTTVFFSHQKSSSVSIFHRTELTNLSNKVIVVSFFDQWSKLLACGFKSCIG